MTCPTSASRLLRAAPSPAFEVAQLELACLGHHQTAQPSFARSRAFPPACARVCQSPTCLPLRHPLNLMPAARTSANGGWSLRYPNRRPLTGRQLIRFPTLAHPEPELWASRHLVGRVATVSLGALCRQNTECGNPAESIQMRRSESVPQSGESSPKTRRCKLNGTDFQCVAGWVGTNLLSSGDADSRMENGALVKHAERDHTRKSARAGGARCSVSNAVPGLCFAGVATGSARARGLSGE